MSEPHPVAGPNDARAAIVTGATAGIGLATARLLVARGWRVLAVGRDPGRLDDAMKTLGSAAQPCRADVGKPDGPAAIVQAGLRAFGRIDGLVNNAGVAPLTPIAQHSPELIDRTFATNTIGPAKLIVAAWPHLIATRGRLVNVSSVAARDPFPGFFAYAASKAAVEMLAVSAAKEGHAAGVRAFAVAPGATETGMFRALFDESAVPRSDVLDPSAVASLIVDCLTGGRDADNGTTITIQARPAGAP